MPNYLKLAILAGVVAFAAACAREPEPVVMAEPEPVMAEPTFNKM